MNQALPPCLLQALAPGRMTPNEALSVLAEALDAYEDLIQRCDALLSHRALERSSMAKAKATVVSLRRRITDAHTCLCHIFAPVLWEKVHDKDQEDNASVSMTNDTLSLLAMPILIDADLHTLSLSLVATYQG